METQSLLFLFTDGGQIDNNPYILSRLIGNIYQIYFHLVLSKTSNDESLWSFVIFPAFPTPVNMRVTSFKEKSGDIAFILISVYEKYLQIRSM